MTPGEFQVVAKGRVKYALMERLWMDTMAAGIASTVIRAAGVDIERSDCFSFNYPEGDHAPEVMTVEDTVDVLKQWVTVTGGRSV
jgi:hypothetical protein